MPAFGNRVTTTTQDKIYAKLVDGILNSNVLATDFLKNAKPWVGEKYKVPFKYKKGANGGYFTGYDVLSTEASDTDIMLEFTSTNYYLPINIPKDEVSINDTAKVADIIDRTVTSRTQDFADEIGDAFWAGDGTGKQFNGIDIIVDNGTNSSTIGGQSRATYTNLKATVTASSGTLTLLKMATLFSTLSHGKQQPDVIYTTKEVFNLYEQLRQPIERYMVTQSDINNGLKMGGGAMELVYKGMPVKVDEKCTSGNLYMIKRDTIKWCALPFKGNKTIPYVAGEVEGNDYDSVAGLGFTWTGWKEPINQLSWVAHLVLSGNLIVTDPRKNGKLTGITTI